MIILKSKHEIEAMREAGRLVARTLDLVCAMVQPGVTTGELDRAAEDYIRSQGGIPTCKGYCGCPATLCTSVNEEVVHGIPGPRILKEGDIVGIDCVATLNGYIGDATRTVPVGRISAGVQRLLDSTKAALFKAIELARPGEKLGTLSHAVEAHVTPLGYTVVRDYCGHGVGRQMHEDPQVPNHGLPGRGPVIKPGWTIAIEPMINLGVSGTKVLGNGWTVVTLDGMPSAHFEHTVAVTEDGPVILTLP
jgi:methionyl aminopeptidase